MTVFVNVIRIGDFVSVSHELRSSVVRCGLFIGIIVAAAEVEGESADVDRRWPLGLAMGLGSYLVVCVMSKLSRMKEPSHSV